VSKKSKFEGKSCWICKRPYKLGLRFVEHHLSYEKEGGEDITVVLCQPCHDWLHFCGRRHPVLKEFPRGQRVWYFIRRANLMYEEHGL